MKNWADEITNNPLAVHLGATVVNVTKIQEIDDPKGDTFNVVLVSGVTAWGKLDQYDAAMQKYLDYLDFTHRKLCIDISQVQEFETISNNNFDNLTSVLSDTITKYRDLLNGRPESK
jgi:hypothetical protein